MKEQSQRDDLPNNCLPVLQVIKTCINCNTHPALLECLNFFKGKNPNPHSQFPQMFVFPLHYLSNKQSCKNYLHLLYYPNCDKFFIKIFPIKKINGVNFVTTCYKGLNTGSTVPVKSLLITTELRD